MSSSWLDRLTDEDKSFIKRFVLASGSLKAVAKAYGVSYPTIRNRLNALISKVEIFDAETPMSEFERQLRAAHADGSVDLATLKRLLKAHQQDRNHDRSDPPSDAPDNLGGGRAAAAGRDPVSAAG